jgi:hypothetical protein
MRNWIKCKVSIKYLIFIFIIVVTGLVLTESSKVKTTTPYCQLQYQAAKIMS